MSKEFWESDTPVLGDEFWASDVLVSDTSQVPHDGDRDGKPMANAIPTMLQVDIDAAAHEAATSPLNDKPQPSEEQKKAGNYSKGHIRFHGLDLTIENPAGSVRSGTSPDGKDWQTEMKSHYGYIKGSVGADKEHVDVFLGPDPESRMVFVVDQINADGSFDEHKCLLGFSSETEAREGYLENYAPGWTGMGAITPLPMAAFKAWVMSGKLKDPLGDIPEPGDALKFEPIRSVEQIEEDIAGHRARMESLETLLRRLSEAGASLTSCLRVIGKAITKEDRSTILERARARRSEGLKPTPAAIKAVEDAIFNANVEVDDLHVELIQTLDGGTPWQQAR